MTPIGDKLRSEREKRRLALKQIAEDLKISCRMLTAIEEEKFEQLPGGVFARSFVRQYARYLGMDDQEIARQLDEILNPAPESAPFTETPKFADPPKTEAAPIHVPRVENWHGVSAGRGGSSQLFTALGLVAVAILGCAGIYAWWQRTPHPASVREAADLSSAPAAQSAPSIQHAAARTVQSDNAPVRVEVTAEEPAWVEIRTDGRVTYSGILMANQSRNIDANSAVALIVGNAGGVSIILNGKPIGSVGAKGQVRNLQLTSGGFEIVPPKSAASLDEMDPM